MSICETVRLESYREFKRCYMGPGSSLASKKTPSEASPKVDMITADVFSPFTSRLSSASYGSDFQLHILLFHIQSHAIYFLFCILHVVLFSI